MPIVRAFNLEGLNLQLNPLAIKPTELIRSVNIDNYEFGSKKKRAGYTTFLGTADGSQVNSLSSWTKNDGTSIFLHRASGSSLYYYEAGIGTGTSWNLSGNGTITAGSAVRGAVLEDTLVVGDGAAATRHSTDGTSFTNTSSAPVAHDFVEYQNRIWAAGTGSDLFYSTTGTATDWTSDSSSIAIPGAGKLGKIYKASDRLMSCKTSGLMFSYDGYNLRDLATDLGPTSIESIGEVEDVRLGLNRLGVFSYTAVRPEIISNKIQRQIYNDPGEGIIGTTFDNASGAIHRYDYFLSVGTVTDDLTDEEVGDCIIKYDYQLNEFSNYKFADRPTAFLSYKDKDGNQQLIFGDAAGQCYTFGGTSDTDNGSTIEAVMEFVVHLDTLQEKDWRWFRALFNPGCQAKVSIATSNTFTRGKKKWKGLGNASSGTVEFHFPEGSQSTFLFVKLFEASRNTRFNFYGYEVDASIVERR